MRVTVLAAGSRGDVEPYLALARGLTERGYSVRFAANDNFRNLTGKYGVDFFPIDVDSSAFVLHRRAQAWLESTNPLQLALRSARVVGPSLARVHSAAWEACQGCEAIVYHSFVFPMGYYFGKMLGVPALCASIYPTATRSFPAPSLNLRRSYGGAVNLASHRLVEHFTWQMHRRASKPIWLGKLDIPVRNPLNRIMAENAPVVCGYSSHLSPRTPDCPRNVHIVGYWLLDASPGWTPAPEVEEFLCRGSAPVFFGFASMGNPARAGETAEIILEALSLTGQRGFIVSGWSGLGAGVRLPDTVLSVRDVPYSWLLPKMAAIVHHAGAGSTGHALRAGKPNVVVPHFADNHFWASCVESVGASPASIPRRKLTATLLAQTIEEALNRNSIEENAARIGKSIRAERGIADTVEIFERLVLN